MIVVMKVGSSQDEISGVKKRIEDVGLKSHISEGIEHTVIGVLGQVFPELRDTLELLPGVEQVIPVSKPYKLASREFHPRDTIVKINGVAIGGNEIVVMAGPCAVESEEQLLATAQAVKAAGATVLRGGAFKPRTSPYQFRGLGESGLHLALPISWTGRKRAQNTGTGRQGNSNAHNHRGYVARPCRLSSQIRRYTPDWS